MAVDNSGVGVVGARFEVQSLKNKNSAYFLSMNYAHASVSRNGVVYNGSGGYNAEIGHLCSLEEKKTNEGVYSGLSVSYNHCNFNEADYSGAYKYIGWNVYLGYKAMLGKYFVYDMGLPFVIVKTEIKPEGNIDNKSFANSEFRLQVNVGYRF